MPLSFNDSSVGRLRKKRRNRSRIDAFDSEVGCGTSTTPLDEGIGLALPLFVRFVKLSRCCLLDDDDDGATTTGETPSIEGLVCSLAVAFFDCGMRTLRRDGSAVLSVVGADDGVG